jgi:GT2 family glycosyltransferase
VTLVSRLHEAPVSDVGARPLAGCTIGVVIVSYNSGGVLQGCLAGLGLASHEVMRRFGAAVRTVIVDNASQQPPSADGFETIELASNLGFAAAANIGIRQVAGADFVLLLNPDARLERDALAELLEAFANPCTAVSGPLLVGDDGAPRPSERPFHSLKRELVHQLLPVRSRVGSYVGQARCLTGACLLIDGAFLAEVGGLDETIRMYLEDVELCWLAHERGRRVAHVNTSICRHDLGGSSGGTDFRTSVGLHLTLLAARVEFVRRRSGVVAAACMRAAMALGAILRIPFHLARGHAGIDVAVAVWAVRSGRAPAWEEIARC